MFVSRKEELKSLENLYHKDKFQMVVMYGRRRVGKTTLINEFLKDKPSIFFAAQEANEHLNLKMFSEKVYSFFDLPETMGAFKNWHDAFMFIADRSKKQKFILAIDEFPYIVESNKGVKSILQNVIDHYFLDTELYIILCGSQISFMENEILGYKSPLFGRRTAQFKIEGFDYYDASLMLGNISNEDKIKYYACVGGTPHYLSQIDTKISFEDNIKQLFFSVQGYLYGEPNMLLQQELREPAMYNSIISAIATGSSRLNEISTKLDEDSSKTIKYIKILMDLRILHKEHPFGDNPERSKKSIYYISDNCYNFWYKYVFLNKTGIEKGVGEEIADYLVFPNLSEFIGKPAFEEICKQYIIKINKKKKLPFLATDFGIWWGNDKKEKMNTDFDVVADNKFEKQVLLCECKWRNDYSDVKEIKKLMSKIYLMPGYEKYHFMFFSKVAFSKEAIKLESENDNLKLVTLDMLFEI